jgi:hypothetical protein
MNTIFAHYQACTNRSGLGDSVTLEHIVTTLACLTREAEAAGFKGLSEHLYEVTIDAQECSRARARLGV